MPQKGFSYRVYILGNKEFFEMKSGIKYSKLEFPLFDSLFSFLYLDVMDFIGEFSDCAKQIEVMCREKDFTYANKMNSFLRGMSRLHPYFEITRLVWEGRFYEAREQGFINVSDLLPKKELMHIPSTIAQRQKQITWLLETALDLDSRRGDMQGQLLKYFKRYQDELLRKFPFHKLNINFEIVENKAFAEVLYPENIYDIVDFFLRECIKREQPIRRCKNCQKYFAIHGRTDTEYCSRPIDDLGRTCRDLGASYVWERKKKEDEVFRVYRREYKKRFAWIKAKKIDADEFYAWSERAREKKAKCDRGEISLEEFKEWLKR